MKLLKLTSIKNDWPVYISSSTIVAIYKQDHITIIETNAKDFSHYVKESPEEILAQANSANQFPDAYYLIQFAQWYSMSGTKVLGRSYASIVNDYLKFQEKRHEPG